ncbi:MAG: thiamine-phosphate kinase, partial [Kiritimatiellia bacterium]|nr:thiamine-phosphate kinase [Kiritimatiellia bacterium]
RRLPLRNDVIVGAGDDCAVVRATHSDGFDYLLKSDSCIEGVHFAPQTKGELIGNKALGRVLSDIAAMGGEPLWILIDLVAPSKTPVRHIEQIYAGMTKLARQFKVAIVGGDVSAGRDLQLHVFGIGRVKKGKAILRSGAKPGEAIFVTGSLGSSLSGKHLEFQPRLNEGSWLASNGWASAMIDVSDGLLRDLRHIISASKVGIGLILDAIPISAAARRSAAGKNALKHALNDGEDYELLFTVPERKADSFIKAWRRTFKLACVCIGQTTCFAGRLEGTDSEGRKIKLHEAGFDHFRKKRDT